MEAESDQQGWRVFMDCVVNDDDDDVWTCVEDHEIIGWIPSLNSAVHVDVVSHGNRAVPEGSEGHAPDC